MVGGLVRPKEEVAWFGGAESPGVALCIVVSQPSPLRAHHVSNTQAMNKDCPVQLIEVTMPVKFYSFSATNEQIFEMSSVPTRLLFKEGRTSPRGLSDGDLVLRPGRTEGTSLGDYVLRWVLSSPRCQGSSARKCPF